MSANDSGISDSPLPPEQANSPNLGGPDELLMKDHTQFCKVVIIDRLKDLIARLSEDLLLKDSDVSSVFVDVDHIEQVVDSAEIGGRSTDLPGKRISEGHTSSVDVAAQVARSSTPSYKIALSAHDRESQNSYQSLSVSKAVQIAKEAEELASRLSKTVKELQARKEESDHIHDLLITRLELAAERILFLESRVAELEDDEENNLLDLKFLRIQMQALETQASRYIPHDEDPELAASIRSWKRDWQTIENEAKERKGTPRLSLSPATMRRS